MLFASRDEGKKEKEKCKSYYTYDLHARLLWTAA